MPNWNDEQPVGTLHKLIAANPSDARRKVHAMWPNHQINLFGYDKTGILTYITVVRAKGNKRPVATATSGRGGRPVQFQYSIDDVPDNQLAPSAIQGLLVDAVEERPDGTLKLTFYNPDTDKQVGHLIVKRGELKNA